MILSGKGNSYHIQQYSAGAKSSTMREISDSNR